MMFVECPAALWLKKHRPDLLPEATPELERVFAMGREVDELAKTLYPGGVEVSGYNQDGWANTKQTIANDTKIMFQPTAITQELSARADILTYDDESASWDIREVKMSTKVKPEHVIDLAFQRTCFEEAGIKIGRTFLVHLNNKYERHGDIEPEKLFVSEDITKDVLKKKENIRSQIDEALTVMAGNKTPDEFLIQKCDDPGRCEFIEYYVKGIPETYSIAEKLPYKYLLAFLNRGVFDQSKLDQDLVKKSGYVPKVQVVEIDAPGIRHELAKLEYPLHFLDYETYGPGIPPFDGCHPYQQIPFQYSLFIKKDKDTELEYIEFLARSFENPMPEFLDHLHKHVHPKGSVIVWNGSFEAGRNLTMMVHFPKYAKFLESINARLFDLMLIFKFNKKLYIHGDFDKSASLKKVLPVICPELSYESLGIKEGGEASASWPVLTSPNTSDSDKEKLAKDMLEYCKRDSEAMVCILEHVQGKVSSK